ncbi:MAG: sulfatase-like hydrolase/transferase [Planctomycetes bacterium]|nr:sulfatase-like hydrolase/transferase [Planctomycetota bacterium]
MPQRPNILFLMVDQMQGQVLDPSHPCRTPNFDRLAQRGVRITRAYTPNAVCSPARASLMTGLLPHNHGVLEVIHCVDDDQCNLRTEHPHWAQRLSDAGYRTGYFGKWHVERSERLDRFGWQAFGAQEPYASVAQKLKADAPAKRKVDPAVYLDHPPSYPRGLLCGVTDAPPELRGMGIHTSQALAFLEQALEASAPWCCVASVTEPHDPFVCGRAAYETYDPEALPLPGNCADRGAPGAKPGLYRKCASVWDGVPEQQHRMARACYYASITEIDAQFGRLIDRLEQAGQLENTIVVLTSDHGELLGAHGLYCKNISAYEEVYRIPMLACGPGIAAGGTSAARVGLHELGPTLLELAGAEPLGAADGRSFAEVLKDPARGAEWSTGFAAYYGSRYRLTQNVYWDGDWKYVHNGFDIDELYDLAADPGELHNLAGEPAQAGRLAELAGKMWDRLRRTGERNLTHANYPPLRLAPRGPGA